MEIAAQMSILEGKLQRARLILIVFIATTIALGGVTIGLSLEHQDIIAQKNNDYEALWDSYGAELDRNTRLEMDLLTSENEVIMLEENMEMLAVLQPIMPFTEPLDAFEIVKDFEASSPFDSGFKITSRWGEGPGYNGSSRIEHQGTDIVPEGSWYVNPMWPGRVIEIGIDFYYGKFIVIEHSDMVRTKYTHLQTIYNTALPESEVDTSIIIGLMGSTGYSDAAHLHVELLVSSGDEWRSVDIYPWLLR